MKRQACIECREEKLIEQFARRSRNGNKRRSTCLRCCADKQRKRRWADVAAARERERKAYRNGGRERALKALDANRDEIRARNNAWAKTHPAEMKMARRRAWLKEKYGLTPERFEQMLAAQSGGCAICGAPESGKNRHHVDHDHETNAVRAILCTGCNAGLGNFADDIPLMLAAIDYLVKHGASGILVPRKVA